MTACHVTPLSNLLCSDTNHDSLLSNTTYTGPPRLRYLFQVVQTQTMAAYCRIYLHWTTMFEIFFQVVQTQTTTAYCRILPTLDHHVSDIFSGSSDTNHVSLLYCNSTETAPSLVSLAHRRKVNMNKISIGWVSQRGAHFFARSL